MGYNYIGDYMKKLKKIRIKNGLTCSDMALKLSISKPFYWQLENDKRNLSYKMAIKIASIFNMKPDDIFYKDYK